MGNKIELDIHFVSLFHAGVLFQLSAVVVRYTQPEDSAAGTTRSGFTGVSKGSGQVSFQLAKIVP